MNIQAVCGGYEGKQATVFGHLDEDTDKLTIIKLADVRFDRFKDCRVVTNLPQVKEWEAMFSEEHLANAIAAFHARNTSGRFATRAEAARANPANGLQLLKVTEKGRDYEIITSVTNDQIGVLMMCWYAETAQNIKAAMAFGGLLERLQRGEMWTA